MEILDPQDGKRMLSSSSFKSDATGNESVHYEKFLLDDLDNYWDELNDRLTVTRMVNDSVIKGIVNALIAESKENIMLKDVEIEILNKKMHSLHDISPSKHSTTYKYLNCNNIDNICRLRLVAKDHIRKLKENIHNADMGMSGMLSKEMKNENLIEGNRSVNSLGTVVDTLFEEIDEMHEIQLQAKVEREIYSIIFGSSVEYLQNKFEKKLYEQISLKKKLYIVWQQKVNELSRIRDHLNSLSNTLSNTESKLLLSHNSLDSLDSFEEWNTPKRKELVSRKVSGGHHKEENGTVSKNIKSDVPDASQLKHLNRDELIDYYKNEMINMRRQHESALQEKTEELFKLKREFLRQKGSSPFKKDHEILRKKIPEIIIKLNDIILEKETMLVVQFDKDELCILRNNIDKLHSENEILKMILAEKNKESESPTLSSQASDIDKLHSENENSNIIHAKENKETESPSLSSQASDVESQVLLRSSLETKFLQQIKTLEKGAREMETESYIRDMVRSIIVKEVICENKRVVDDLEIETRIMQDVINTVVNGYTHDVMSAINSIILRDCTEKSYVEALLCEKEKTLNIEIEKNTKLEEKIASLSTLTKDEEKHSSESEQLNRLIKEVICENKRVVDDLETEARMIQDVINIVVSGYTHDVLSALNSIILSDCTEKSHLEALLCEKEKALNVEIEKNMKLEEKISSLSTLTEDEEKHVSQPEQLNQSLKEIEMLKEQVSKQEALISNKEAQKDLLNNEINDALQQLHQYDSNFIKLNGELANVSKALVEAEKQISLLQGIMEENQKKQAKQSEFIVKSITVLLEASANFEHKVAEKIQRNESRLKVLNLQSRSLVQQANKFPNRELLYKQMFDIKSSNLQKAEAEVDLLGDEVDTLLTLLGKIYIALDHYSPVLKHYPGVMETLKLVRRELGEPEDSVNRKTERQKRTVKSVSKFG